MWLRRGRRLTTMTGIALLAAVSVACGSDPTDTNETQPAPDVTTFEEGAFEQLPLYPDSEPIGARSEKDGVVTRSYKVQNVTVDMILAFYAERLEAAGWERAEPALRENTESRADWVNDQHRLEISAQDIRGPEDPPSDQHVVQYSLVLHPL